MKLNVFSYVTNTKVEGPGIRSCIWVQGCSKQCAGCFSPYTWKKNTAHNYDIDTLFNKITENQYIEGITISGGEPFEQAEPVSRIVKKAKAKKLSVIILTGKTDEEIFNSENTFYKEIIDNVDVLKTGPFDAEKIDYTYHLKGSENQKLHFFTDIYCLDDFLIRKNEIELRILENGSILQNGTPQALEKSQLGVTKIL
ncbi:MAG: 4Fe-4S single cluster domain-containing protein [Candidatus Muiribacteriota bacterium]|jgi:anaerobic ribonucleoside-triphosphate reductase activating protein